MEGMSIKDAAKALNVESHVLRYWEEELGLEIKRNSLGHRYYDERDIKMFRQVQELKNKGFALKDIRDGIERHNKELHSNTDSGISKNTDMSEEENDVASSNKDAGIEGKKDICNEGKNHEQVTVKKEEELKVIDFKVAQMQTIMNKIVANALRDNKDIITTSIKEEITTDVMKQFDVVMREKEEKEEARFRKLDETLRRLQQVNEEVAATKIKKKFRWRK